ncbi:Protein of unknown function [Rathayibacter oskolensis]|uniref:DUF2855 family protein n=1 Tax=Rathayibacter oskolensis TaxID=1891671 RepID=A0A1X7PI65_9MICO|nr:DUF2855 family protein [Rathayibacter oskolensis]SMH51051.1 Protein of unknown function [Rathayibacter oskolensis]
MTVHTATTFEVRLDDPLGSSRLLTETLREPEPGEIVLEVERFGLTSNNLTYALLGNETPTRYWDAFPAADGWGRVPAWGSARVIDGDESVARPGERFVGLLPMADRFVFAGRRAEDGVLVGSATGRNAMPSMYRDLHRVEDEDAAQGSAAEVLLRPFFTFAALLAREVSDGGAETAVVTSASSKAGLLLGRLLQQGGVRTVGLTAAPRVAATESTGAFTEVRSYSDVSGLTAEGRTVLLDIAGNAEVSSAVARQLSDDLARIIVVGATHHDAAAGAAEPDDSPSPEVDLFDTAEHEAGYSEEHGAAALRALEDDAREALLPWASRWIQLDEVEGVGSLEEAWRTVQEPPASPLRGIVVTASPRRGDPR